MVRSIVLLRGVNVGGHNPLSMEYLRAALTNAGFDEVESYLQSGNLGVTAPGPVDPEHIRRVVRQNFDLDVPVVVVSPAELEVIAMRNPFVREEDDLSKLHVYLLDRHPVTSTPGTLDPAAFGPDRFALDGRALYVHYPHGAARTRLTVGTVEKAFGVTATARNMKTVLRLISL